MIITEKDGIKIYQLEESDEREGWNDRDYLGKFPSSDDFDVLVDGWDADIIRPDGATIGKV